MTLWWTYRTMGCVKSCLKSFEFPLLGGGGERSPPQREAVPSRISRNTYARTHTGFRNVVRVVEVSLQGTNITGSGECNDNIRLCVWVACELHCSSVVQGSYWYTVSWRSGLISEAAGVLGKISACTPPVFPLSYFSFQPVFHDWCNKGCGMCYLWDDVHKGSLTANQKE